MVPGHKNAARCRDKIPGSIPPEPALDLSARLCWFVGSDLALRKTITRGLLPETVESSIDPIHHLLAAF